MHEDFLRRAIRLAVENARSGGGGPFGAVIVNDGEVVGEGVNLVTASCDPTAHAEISAIRDACRRLSRFELRGCTIYSSCEPCPMCLSAIYWARLDALYFAAAKDNAAEAGFDDHYIYEQIPMPWNARALQTSRLLPREGIEPFDAWRAKPDRIPY